MRYNFRIISLGKKKTVFFFPKLMILNCRMTNTVFFSYLAGGHYSVSSQKTKAYGAGQLCEFETW